MRSLKSVRTGAFTNGATFGSTFQASVSAHDFNGDGRMDLVSGSSGLVEIFLQNGSGGFSVAQTFSSTFTTRPRIADMNNDGISDLVTHDYVSPYLRVYHGVGDGTFTLGSIIAASSPSAVTFGLSSIAVGDLDGDGDRDIVEAYTATGTQIAIHLNNGNGSYSRGATISAGANQFINLGDFNADGALDLAYNSTSDVMVRMGVGDGTFGGPTTLMSVMGANFAEAQVVDLNDDGIDDLIFGGQLAIGWAVSNGDGTFRATGSNLTVALGNFWAPRAADLNGDGRPDIIVGDGGGNVAVLEQSASGTFSSLRTFLAAAATSGYQFTPVNLKNDGAIDLVTTTFNGLRTFYNGTQELSASSDLTVETASEAQALLDILDTAVENPNANRAELGAVHSRAEFTVNANLLLSENLEEACGNLANADIATEVAEMTRLQIMQQAQVAVAAQANVSLQVVLQLLRDNSS